MNIIAAIALALALIFGSAASAETPVQTTTTTVEVQTASEEIPVSDIEAQVLANDAAATWTDYMDIPQVGEDVAYNWVMTSTVEPDEIPATMVVLQSIDLPNVWHVYEAEILAHA